MISAFIKSMRGSDPVALQVAVAAHQALKFVGLPEAKLNLSQSAVYLSLAPKWNASAQAISKAEADVNEDGPLPILLISATRISLASRSVGAGEGYECPHAHGGYVRQGYLPVELAPVAVTSSRCVASCL